MSCGCVTPSESCSSCTPCNCCPPLPTPDLPVCPDPEPCDVAIDSQCVIYTGGDLQCIGIQAGDPPIIRLDEILEKLDTAVCESGLSITFVENTDCIGLSGEGTQASPISATPILKDDDTNLLQCTATGLLANVYLENTDCINLTGAGTVSDPISASINLNGDTLICDGDGLYVNPDILDTLTFNNGLTRTVDTVQLGGDLEKNTSINLTADNYYLQVLSNTAGNIARFSDDNLKTVYSVGTSSSDLSTVLKQTSTKFEVTGTTYSNINSSGYIANSVLSVNSSTSTAILGSNYPVGSSSTFNQAASYFSAYPFNAVTQGYSILLNTPSTTINSGSLESGVKYIITQAGGIFTASGSTSNSVGTVFTANSTPPTWGTGEVELHGEINQVASYSQTILNRTKFDISVVTDPVFSPVSNVSDFGLISTYNPGYYETQIYSEFKRSGTAYITEGVVILKCGATTTSPKYAIVGVSTPTSNNIAVDAPDSIPQTAFTQWFSYDSASSGTDNGLIKNFAPYVSFLGLVESDGVTPVVNDGWSRVGINVTSAVLDTVTTTLNITGPDDTPLVNIAKDYAPTVSGDPGKKGDITWGEDGGSYYVYVCVADNTWKRSLLSGF